MKVFNVESFVTAVKYYAGARVVGVADLPITNGLSGVIKIIATTVTERRDLIVLEREEIPVKPHEKLNPDVIDQRIEKLSEELKLYGFKTFRGAWFVGNGSVVVKTLSVEDFVKLARLLKADEVVCVAKACKPRIAKVVATTRAGSAILLLEVPVPVKLGEDPDVTLAVEGNALAEKLSERGFVVVDGAWLSETANDSYIHSIEKLTVTSPSITKA